MERLVLWHRVAPAARDDAQNAAAIATWTRGVIAQSRAAGATLLGAVGSAVAAAFDPADYTDALELALGLLEACEKSTGSAPLRIAFGVALGEIEAVESSADGTPFYAGAAIERAQLLANRARGGELLLDASARSIAGAIYLFERRVGAGSAHRGHAIDRRYPRRESCRAGLARLRRGCVPEMMTDALAPLRTYATSKGSHAVVVRGPWGAGTAAYVGALEGELQPPMLLRVGTVPGSLEPLGGFRLALLRIADSADALAIALARRGLQSTPRNVLVRLASGKVVSREEASPALRSLLKACEENDKHAWVFVESLDALDAASADILGDVLRDPDVRILLVARLPTEGKLPDALLQDARIEDLTLPPLHTADARALAEAILEAPSGSDIARRVAVLGGDTPLGVEEAARALVAAGDLVFDGAQFVWRVGPRPGVTAAPTEMLVHERLASVDENAMRILEIISVAGDGLPSTTIDAIAEQDGLDVEARTTSIQRLRDDAWLEVEAPLRMASQVVRVAVLESIQPARAAELHRFTASVLETALSPSATYAHATRGFHLALGGQGRDGARTLLEAASASVDAGFARAAMRLAAAAVEIDPSIAVRDEAARITRTAAGPQAVPARPSPSPPAAGPRSVPPPNGAGRAEQSATSIVKQTVDAILNRDFERVHRCLDWAVADGRDRAAAERVRAIAHLAQGDAASALRALTQVRVRTDGDPRQGARASLALALILLHTGEASRAVRAALGALSTARSIGDAQGEAAALHALAACYRALGREAEAVLLEQAQPLNAAR